MKSSWLQAAIEGIQLATGNRAGVRALGTALLHVNMWQLSAKDAHLLKGLIFVYSQRQGVKLSVLVLQR